VDRDKNELRWGIEQRLEFIEFRLFWEGHVNRIDVMQQFGVSVNQASSDLNRYIALAPDNMVYDKSARTYVRGPDFDCKFRPPDAAHSPGPYGTLRSRHLEDLPALVTKLARQTKDAPLSFKRFAATVMEKHYVSPTEIKEKVGELAKQGLIKPTWKTRKEKARVPDGGDLIVWIGDEIT